MTTLSEDLASVRELHGRGTLAEYRDEGPFVEAACSFIRDHGQEIAGLAAENERLKAELTQEIEASARNDQIAIDCLHECSQAKEAAESELAACRRDAERLRAAIVEHNNSYGACDKVKCGYAPYKYRECPECPAQHVIDLAAIDAQSAIDKLGVG
jgi:hypothetical protein